MTDFQLTLQQIPLEIKQAWNSGFVFVHEKKHFWHFPARKWTEQQIQTYFTERYAGESFFIDHPESQLKQLVLLAYPELFIIIPYFRKEH